VLSKAALSMLSAFMDKDSEPLIRINLSPFRDKYNLD